MQNEFVASSNQRAYTTETTMNYMRCPQLLGGRDWRGSDRPTTMKSMTLEREMALPDVREMRQAKSTPRPLSVCVSVCVCVFMDSAGGGAWPFLVE